MNYADRSKSTSNTLWKVGKPMIEYTEQERMAAAEKVHEIRYPNENPTIKAYEISRWSVGGYDTMTDIAIDLQMRLTKAEELLLKYRFQHRRSADCKIFANIAGDQRCPICTKYDAFLEGSKA